VGKDIFLSYARADHERAEQIKELLEGLGLTVFFDTEGLDGGHVFHDVIDREVKAATAVVGVWSRHALTRPWVKKECSIGLNRQVLVPVLIEPVPALERPIEFYDIQYDDLTDFSGDPEHAGWLRFIKSLARVLKRPELLERENAAQNALLFGNNSELQEELAAMREQISEMKSTKEQLFASVQEAQQNETATNLELWREIKNSDNIAALRRFLETVRDTPLEHLVEAKLVDLERVEDPTEPASNHEFEEATWSDAPTFETLPVDDVHVEGHETNSETIAKRKSAKSKRKRPVLTFLLSTLAISMVGVFAAILVFGVNFERNNRSVQLAETTSHPNINESTLENAPEVNETARPAKDKHIVVENIQRRLNELGYSVGEIDGLIGPNTQSAIYNFSEKTGIMSVDLSSAEYWQLVQFNRFLNMDAAISTSPSETSEPQSEAITDNSDVSAEATDYAPPIRPGSNSIYETYSAQCRNDDAYACLQLGVGIYNDGDKLEGNRLIDYSCELGDQSACDVLFMYPAVRD